MAERKLDIKAGTKKPEFTLSETFKSKKGMTPVERIDLWFVERSSVSTKDKVIFFRLLATMVSSGMTLIESLDVLKDQITSSKLRIILSKISNRVSGGSTFSDSIALFPEAFEGSTVGIIRAGEKSGKLSQVLKNLAVQVENFAKLGSKIKGALMYPAVILIIVLVAIYAIMVLVIPQIKDMFSSMGVELPIATQILINISSYLTATNSLLGINNSIVVLMYVIFGGIMIRSFFKSKKGGLYLSFIVLKLPIVNSLFQKMIIAKFCRGLSILIGSGMSLIDALALVSGMLGNEAYRIRVLKIIQDVKQGLTMSQNMKNDLVFFPPMLVSMLSVGEKTAQLEEVSRKVAEFYEDEVDTMVKSLMTLLEPMIIVLVGTVIGGIIMAVMLPILSLSDLAGG